MIPSGHWVERGAVDPEARLRLFCFPYAGGGASLFRDWQDFLPRQVEVCPVQLPGRESRIGEAPFTSMEPLVLRMVEELETLRDPPFALFGHSLGALIVFELARALRRFGLPSPVRLFVSGHRAPQLPHADPPIHQLPDSEFLAELGELSGTPGEVLQDPELMELLLPLLRADFAIAETYTYADEAPLDCPVAVFGGRDDEQASRDELQAWRAQTRDSFSLHLLDGDHFFLVSARSVLLQVLSAHLERMLKASGG